MTVAEIGRIVSQWAAGEPLIRRVYLFGSQAKGTATPCSAIDLAVLHSTDRLVGCDPGRAREMTWWGEKERWRSQIALLFALPVQLETCGWGQARMRTYLRSCRTLLYRRIA